MKTFWKWVLSIVIVLVVIAALVAVPFAMRTMAGARFHVGNLPQRSWNAGPGTGNWSMPMNPHMGRGGTRFGGFMPFGFGFMLIGGLFRGLIPLALLGLLAYGAYRLGKRNTAPVAAAAPAVVAPVEPSAPAAPARTCASCGKPAQDDWKTCPYCGAAL